MLWMWTAFLSLNIRIYDFPIIYVKYEWQYTVSPPLVTPSSHPKRGAKAGMPHLQASNTTLQHSLWNSERMPLHPDFTVHTLWSLWSSLSSWKAIFDCRPSEMTKFKYYLLQLIVFSTDLYTRCQVPRYIFSFLVNNNLWQGNCWE